MFKKMLFMLVFITFVAPVLATSVGSDKSLPPTDQLIKVSKVLAELQIDLSKQCLNNNMKACKYSEALNIVIEERIDLLKQKVSKAKSLQG